MQDLATNLNVNTGLLRMLFLQRMPVNIRTVLAVCSNKLDELATMADKMIDVSSPQVAATQQAASTSVQDLEAQIAALTSKLRRLETNPNRGRSRSPSRRRSSSQSSSQDICWYHRKFRDAAQQCRSPCRYSSKN